MKLRLNDLSCLTFFVLILSLTSFRSLRSQEVSGKISGGWRMPIMEENRLRTLLTGEGAEPLKAEGLRTLRISKLKIQLFNDQTPPQLRLIIQAPECRFDSNSQTASSPRSIFMSSPDEAFSLSGKGFRWEQSRLSVSNNVQTLISKKASQAQTPVKVKANRFEYDKSSHSGHYLGEVHVTQGEHFEMESDELKVRLPEGDALQDISALGKVRIRLMREGRWSELSGHKAHYQNDSTASLLLMGEPSWKSGNYFGHGDRIEITQFAANPIFKVSGNASMNLPQKKDLHPSSQIQIEAKDYSIRNTGAHFKGSVRAQSKGIWQLLCDTLSAEIEKESQNVTRIFAKGNLQIEHHEKDERWIATGDEAEFIPKDSVLSSAKITGNARVFTDDFESHADAIRMNGSGISRTLFAEGKVSITLAREASQGSFFGIALSSDWGKASQNQIPKAIRIDAQSYRADGRRGRFEGNVKVWDERGLLECQALDLEFAQSPRQLKSMIATEKVRIQNPQGELHCQHLEGIFVGSENRLLQLFASHSVELRHSKGIARGANAIFHLQEQRIELIGDAELHTHLSDGRRHLFTKADRLIWDEAHNIFKGRGRYQSRTIGFEKFLETKGKIDGSGR